jgi:hypothetical protein
MTNKASNQQDDIWNVLAKELAEVGKMVFAVFVFVFTADSSKEPSTSSETQPKDGSRDGHSGDGFYTGDIRNDDD